MLMACYRVNQQMSMLTGSGKESKGFHLINIKCLIKLLVVIPKNVFSLIMDIDFYIHDIDLLNISMCSKIFYVLFHKNNRYKLRLAHPKLILSTKNVFDRYLDAWIFVFDDQFSSKLDLTVDLMFAVKDKILNDIIFKAFLFRVYDPLLFL